MMSFKRSKKGLPLKRGYDLWMIIHKDGVLKRKKLIHLNSKVGHNSVQVSYHPKLVMRLGIWITGMSWIVVIIGFLFFRKRKIKCRIRK